MGCDDPTHGISGDNPRSPLPNALELDDAIERDLLAFDLVPMEVRRAAGVIAMLVQRLAPAQAADPRLRAPDLAPDRLTTQPGPGGGGRPYFSACRAQGRRIAHCHGAG